LAALMPNASAFHIEGRDHMLAVGDKTFKQRVLEFYAENPL
ncbi:alpha/beta hydrolase, partial [Mesorhizobium sp. M7A.F.Ca.US.001.01.1.1]